MQPNSKPKFALDARSSMSFFWPVLGQSSSMVQTLKCPVLKSGYKVRVVVVSSFPKTSWDWSPGIGTLNVFTFQKPSFHHFAWRNLRDSGPCHNVDVLRPPLSVMRLSWFLSWWTHKTQFLYSSLTELMMVAVRQPTVKDKMLLVCWSVSVSEARCQKPEDTMRLAFQPSVKPSKKGGRPAFALFQLYTYMVLYLGLTFFKLIVFDLLMRTSMGLEDHLTCTGKRSTWRSRHDHALSNMPRNLELRNAKRFTNVLATALQLASGDTQSGADLLVRAPILPKIRLYCFLLNDIVVLYPSMYILVKSSYTYSTRHTTSKIFHPQRSQVATILQHSFFSLPCTRLCVMTLESMVSVRHLLDPAPLHCLAAGTECVGHVVVRHSIWSTMT